MATAQSASGFGDNPHQRRTKPSAIKSFIHKRTLSKNTGLSSMKTADELLAYPTYSAMLFLPNDHPDAKVLGELHHNNHSQLSSSPKKSRDGGTSPKSADPKKTRHKKALSTVSLRSLTSRDAHKFLKTEDDETQKPKKLKPKTNIASLLSRPRSTKNLQKSDIDEEKCPEKNKENKTPPNSSPIDQSSRPPIYAQFATQFFTAQNQTRGGKFLADEIDLYTPQQYSPGKQRDFHNATGSQPALNRRDERGRPKSAYLPSSFSMHDITKYVNLSGRHSAEDSREDTTSALPTPKLQSTVLNEAMKASKKTLDSQSCSATANSRPASVRPKSEYHQVSTIEDVDGEFEKMLDRRNIPEHQRHKMRSLAVSMKVDFIRQDWAETAAAHSERPRISINAESVEEVPSDVLTCEDKKKRPRSRTFTLSKSSRDVDSPTKRAKAENVSGHTRNKSSDSPAGHTRNLTSASASTASTLISKAKGQLPNDFVNYLRKVQKPESVEVGKLHKLRLLLRNETVAWTDAFIGFGGMEEIVGLLHRTMAIEWREEHEDALLHEVLLCLKALCTTALALRILNEIQETLFPALIHMLFDEEKKGPSEFLTRNIVTSLLFTYLKSARLPERTKRAQIVLSYLRDPQPTEEERPVGFVLEMRRDRPYRVWCKEVANVTKEVFWIFLHNVNFVALPSTGSKSTVPQLIPESYALEHFPQELPPVAAAPYVGGVEWDATNYLASHLDLLNGILASIPTAAERNALREQFRMSGWERCMGGTLRLCKEKFYGGVHAGLRCWVAGAFEDGWDTRDVRYGPSTTEITKKSPRKSPKKKTEDPVPRLDMPKLDFDAAGDKRGEGGWL